MPLFHVSVRHGGTLDEARARLEMAADEIRKKFGVMVQRVDWSADRDSVTVTGAGFVVEMRVDPTEVHVSGDVPMLGALLGSRLATGVKQIVRQTFGIARKG